MKVRRQRMIMQIIDATPIETQDDLASHLRLRGYEVTQATVSRDIKDLGLIKVPYGDNAYRYASPGERGLGNIHARLQRLFQDSVTKLDHSENIILVRTLPGTAQAVASCIDKMELPEIIGTVAGDDTILAIVKPKKAVAKVLKEMRGLLE
ncbi:MAG: arginine repressor [Bacillota bacterium]